MIKKLKKPKSFGRKHGTDDWIAYDRRENVLSLGPASLEGRVVAHELCHFYEHASTPYGLFYDDLNRAKQKCVREFLEERDGEITIPVYDWAKNESNSGIHDKNQIEKHLTPWSNYEFLEAIIEADDLEFLNSVESAEAVRCIEHVEKELPRAFDLETERKNIRVVIDQGVFVRGRFDNELLLRHLGVKQISEGLAQVIEGLTIDSFDELPFDYKFLPMMVLSYLSEARTSANRASIGREAAVTCATIADLSLFTPIGFRFPNLRKNLSNWSDLNPGHRFIKALETVAKLDGWISDFSHSKQLTQTVCDQLDWPSPTDFFAEVNESFPARFLEACKLRNVDHAAFYRFSYDFESEVHEFFVEHMPITSYLDGNAVCGVPSGTDGELNPLRQIRDAYFGRFCHQIMFEKSIVPDQLIPEGLRLSKYFDNVLTTQDLRKLIEERHPWASLIRFQPARKN